MNVDHLLFIIVNLTMNIEAEYTDEHNVLLAMSRMKLDKLQQISSDADIIKLSGKASPVIRS